MKRIFPTKIKALAITKMKIIKNAFKENNNKTGHENNMRVAFSSC